MFGNPFFSDYDDSDYYFSPYGRDYYTQQRRRQQAAEEARRRAELERYHRQKKLEEQEKLRHRQEYTRLLREKQRLQEEREEAERREQYEAAMRRRREEEAAAALRRQRLQGFQPEEENEDCADEVEEEPVFRLMQGPDGRLYRVQVGTTKKKPSKRPIPSTGKENVSRSQGFAPVEEERPSTPQVSIPLSSPEKMELDEMFSGTQSKPITGGDEEEEKKEEEETSHRFFFRRGRSKHRSDVSRKSSGSKKKKNKTKVTVIVEDASDSECEDEFKSPWRNRLPSPGQWMEPVESFDRR